MTGGGHSLVVRGRHQVEEYFWNHTLAPVSDLCVFGLAPVVWEWGLNQGTDTLEEIEIEGEHSIRRSKGAFFVVRFKQRPESNVAAEERDSLAI